MSERRRAEIAEKRARLAALKQARQDREQSARQQLQLSSSASSTPQIGTTTDGEDSRPNSRIGGGGNKADEIESLLRGVGVRSSSGPRTSQGVGTDITPERSTMGEEDRSEPGQSQTEVVEVSQPVPPTPNEEASIPPLPPVEPAPVPSAPVELPPPPPPPKVVYDKSIQTTPDLFPHSHTTSTSSSAQTRGLENDEGDDTTSGGAGRETSDELRARIISELEQERLQLDREIAEEKRLAQLAYDETLKKGLSRPELETIFASPGFSEFLEDSTKVVQRALSESYDYLRDYTIVDDEGREDAEGKKQRVRLLGSWRDEGWGKGRSVTAVDWSPKFPELFVAAYNRNPMAVNEPDGIVAVWNLHLLERPEFVFHAQSDVLSVCFSPFHPNLIIGGTYSGQILLWDTRSRSPNPVLKTPLSASGHTHPVYSLQMVGTQNAHSLISASTDGTVCAWTLDMLARPQESLDLVHPAHTKTDEVSITTLGFPLGETTSFWVGTEEGNVYSANRYDRAGAKAGLNQTEVYKGHSGPVTGMSFHPVEGRVDLSDLFLTCGVDWTIKLWRAGSTNASSGGATSGQSTATAKPTNSMSSTTPGVNSISPLFSFEEADDYVYDVKWHPHHPALFASVDGAGKFDLWNLNLDTEVPIISTLVQQSPSTTSAPNSSRRTNGGPAGLNKLAWDKKDGKRCAVASSDGRVYVYDISQDLITPREGEWEQMRRTCNAALSSNGF
ncbi:dynein intermediate chain [Sporobolomyces salmoneus]|uniref:dynein intermediate chain n=1 Tax=Sporobolomyces salmoneus TaxID=183962 RepID=UPI003179093B